MPKVTVITATRNRPDLLRRAIISVKNQTFQDYEHIIIYDSDDIVSPKVLNDFKDNRIIGAKSIRKPNDYTFCVLNLGIETSKSDYINVLDDDNILLPYHLEILYEKIYKNNYDAVYSKFYHIPLNAGDSSVKSILNRSTYDFSGYDENYYKTVDNIPKRDHLTLLHKKEINGKILYYNLSATDRPRTRSADDGDFMNRLHGLTNNIGVVNEFTAIYYARKACHHLDKEYNDLVLKLPPTQNYVYPELFDDNLTQQIYMDG